MDLGAPEFIAEKLVSSACTDTDLCPKQVLHLNVPSPGQWKALLS
jgi:hypothetical protein